MGGSRGRLISADDRNTAIKQINEACANGARKHKACEILNISIRTIERWGNANLNDKRKGARRHIGNKLTEEEKKMILNIVNQPEYRDLPPCQIVPLLADKSTYIASESSFYRVLREKKQLAHRQKSKAKKYKKPSVLKATGPNQIWSWDITYLPTQVQGIYFYLYMIMDIYSRKIVAWNIHSTQSSDYAAALIKQACIDENINHDKLILHSDNGSPMKGMTMLAMLENLGVTPSFSRPSVSDDNPFSEALFRTVKYHPTFPMTDKFETITNGRCWTIQFVDWYNNRHRHSGLKFITPNQRHMGGDKKILKARHQVYLKAREKQPERWSRHTRNWMLPNEVTLHANRKKLLEKASNLKMAA